MNKEIIRNLIESILNQLFDDIGEQKINYISNE